MSLVSYVCKQFSIFAERGELRRAMLKSPDFSVSAVFNDLLVKHEENRKWGVEWLKNRRGRRTVEAELDRLVTERGYWDALPHALWGKPMALIEERNAFFDAAYETCFSRADTKGFAPLLKRDWRRDEKAAALIERAHEEGWTQAVTAIAQARVAISGKEKAKVLADLLLATNVDDSIKVDMVTAVAAQCDISVDDFLLHTYRTQPQQIDCMAAIVLRANLGPVCIGTIADSLDEEENILAITRAVLTAQQAIKEASEAVFVRDGLIAELLEYRMIATAEALADAGFLPPQEALEIYASMYSGPASSPEALAFLSQHVQAIPAPIKQQPEAPGSRF